MSQRKTIGILVILTLLTACEGRRPVAVEQRVDSSGNQRRQGNGQKPQPSIEVLRVQRMLENVDYLIEQSARRIWESPRRNIETVLGNMAQTVRSTELNMNKKDDSCGDGRAFFQRRESLRLEGIESKKALVFQIQNCKNEPAQNYAVVTLKDKTLMQSQVEQQVPQPETTTEAPEKAPGKEQEEQLQKQQAKTEENQNQNQSRVYHYEVQLLDLSQFASRHVGLCVASNVVSIAPGKCEIWVGSTGRVVRARCQGVPLRKSKTQTLVLKNFEYDGGRLNNLAANLADAGEPSCLSKANSLVMCGSYSHYSETCEEQCARPELGKACGEFAFTREAGGISRISEDRRTWADWQKYEQQKAQAAKGVPVTPAPVEAAKPEQQATAAVPAVPAAPAVEISATPEDAIQGLPAPPQRFRDLSEEERNSLRERMGYSTEDEMQLYNDNAEIDAQTLNLVQTADEEVEESAEFETQPDGSTYGTEPTLPRSAEQNQ